MVYQKIYFWSPGTSDIIIATSLVMSTWDSPKSKSGMFHYSQILKVL